MFLRPLDVLLDRRALHQKLLRRIQFPQDFLFRSGQAAIKEGAYQALTPFFETIKGLPTHLDDLIIVEGHTDNVPINTAKFKNNWELSSARATNIAIFLPEGPIKSLFLDKNNGFVLRALYLGLTVH